MTNDRNSFNQQVIEEFRANGGRVGGRFEGAPLLILHTTGARSGAERLNPLMYQQVGDAWAVFASKAGAPTHPDWFYNVKANPDVTIEVGAETVPVRARIAEGEEHDQIWTRQKESVPTFAEYEKTAGGRVIPVVVLERR
jgi:deazaflavin-dependent oxidoreductase (nitroreductase family)